MLGSKPRRASVRKLPEPIIPDHRSTVDAGSLSPTSPLERDPRSPKGWRKRDSDGIGLGIVAALERTGSGEPLARLIVRNSSCQSIKIAVGTKLEVGSCSKCSSESMASHGSRDDEELRWGEFGGASAFREADFLNYCYLCRKRLHGKDIYMYRGEKAFCSMECRYQQIVSDECQEKCASEASLDISASSYCDGRLFFTGITAA